MIHLGRSCFLDSTSYLQPLSHGPINITSLQSSFSKLQRESSKLHTSGDKRTSISCAHIAFIYLACEGSIGSASGLKAAVGVECDYRVLHHENFVSKGLRQLIDT